MGHERSANLVDPNQIHTHVVKSGDQLQHEASFTPIADPETVFHAGERTLKCAHTPLGELVHRRRLAEQLHLLWSRILLWILRALDEPRRGYGPKYQIHKKLHTVTFVQALHEFVQPTYVHYG